jgi:archaellum component FlaC
VEIDSKKVEERFDNVDRRFDQVDGRFDKVDARLDKVDGRLDKCEERLGGLEVGVAVFTNQCSRLMSDMSELKGEVKGLSKEINNAKIWALLIAAAILGVLARGFHWI